MIYIGYNIYNFLKSFYIKHQYSTWRSARWCCNNAIKTLWSILLSLLDVKGLKSPTCPWKEPLSLLKKEGPQYRQNWNIVPPHWNPVNDKNFIYLASIKNIWWLNKVTLRYHFLILRVTTWERSSFTFIRRYNWQHWSIWGRIWALAS